MSEDRLRPCIPADAAMLALLGPATFLESYAHMLDAADLLAHCRKNHSEAAYTHLLTAPENRAWVAETGPGHVAVGYALCTAPDLPLPDLTSRDYELRRIYLLHRFQGTGNGRALMQTAIENARAQGYARLLLGVHGGNHHALRFYEKSGFHQVGERFFTVGTQTHHDAVLARSL